MKFVRLFSFLLIFVSVSGLVAQNKKTVAPKKIVNKYPESFRIKQRDFDNLFEQKLNTPLKFSDNKYLDKSSVQKNSLNGDIKFLKLKLSYFPKAYMLVQVNGIYSTQIFIMSEDKSVFYKGTLDKEGVLMNKCAEDEIVSE